MDSISPQRQRRVFSTSRTFRSAFKQRRAALLLGLIAAFVSSSLLLGRPPASSALTNNGSITAFSSPLTENFDTLASVGTAIAWTDNVTIPGWYATPVTYNSGTGSSNAGALYSFGAAAAADRALGSIASGATNTIFFAVKLTNNTGGTINSLDISYVGEQWRDGGNATPVAQSITFQYQVANAGTITDANTPSTGWTNLAALDFTSPTFTTVASALNGNAAANRTAKSANLPVTVNNGQEIWLRWQDINDAGNDHGLAIDDFSVTANGAVVNAPVVPSCPATLSTVFGTPASAPLSATDADGTVTSAAITSITPSNPGTISLTGFTPAGVVGGTATATLAVGAATPAGNYNVTITWSNNDPTPQTATCSTAVTVVASGPALIHDIQGTTNTPNFVGTVRTITGIVVGDFQGTAGLGGFFVEEEPSDWDADPATSEGIFVADTSPITGVSVGDVVTVIGTVSNQFNLTQLNPVSSIVVSGTAPLPPLVSPSLPVPISVAADLERFEGMLVQFNQTLYATDTLNLRFGEVEVSANAKLFIPTNTIDPNDNPASGNNNTTTPLNTNVAAVTAQQNLNDRSRVIIDDGSNRSNTTVPPLVPIPYLPLGGTLRLGDTVTNPIGVLSFDFGSFRLEPTAPLVFTPANPRPPSPPSVGSSTARVASFNIENFFVTTPSAGRGADNPAEFIRQRDKIVAALAGLNADVIALIELEKAGGNMAAANLAAALTATGGVGAYAAIPDLATLVGTDPDIKSGIIYRTSSVTPVGPPMTDLAAAPGAYSRDPLTQTFTVNSNGGRFILVVNHLRSKSCAGESGLDLDQGDGQSCANARRRSQAIALVSYLSSLTLIDSDVLMVGDFNSYGQEDPLDTLRAGGLIDEVGNYVPPSEQYSFSFDGQLGRLDHVFSTSHLSSQITGVAFWHINADEPDIIDYNTENKPDDRYAPDAYRCADHDPLVIGLNLAAEAVAPTITCPANISVNNDPGLCSASVAFSVTGTGTPSPTIVCKVGAATITSPNTFPVGTTTVNCTASNGNPPNATCSFTVTVFDTQAPSITCPANITVSNTTGQCSAVVSFSVTATDLCGPATIVSTPASGSTFPKGTTTVTSVATDGSGNTSTCSFTVTVNDTQAPVITCPANVTAANDSGQCSAVVNFAAPTATDNCSGVGTPVCAPASGSSFPKGTTTVTCSVSDASSNSASCSFTVTVNDTQPPSITCPANIVTGNTTGQCSAVVSFPAPVVSDNCSGVGTPTCSPSSGSTFPKGTTTVTCSVADASGNASNCSFTVTVNDTQPPSISCPANITVPCALGQCSALATFSVTATDNCPGVTVVANPPSGSSFPKGTTTVTATATDGSGNTASCSFTVTVVDTQKPSIVCPANITAVVPGATDTCATVSYAPPVATDNCPGVAVACTPPSGTCFPLGITTVTCVATDSSGNTAACSFTVTVFDACLQDDGDPSRVVLVNSLTGDYRFCCGGTMYAGRGTVSSRAGVVTLEHTGSGRRVTIRVDKMLKVGTASLQAPPGSVVCTIRDTNTANNQCACQ